MIHFVPLSYIIIIILRHTESIEFQFITRLLRDANWLYLINNSFIYYIMYIRWRRKQFWMRKFVCLMYCATYVLLFNYWANSWQISSVLRENCFFLYMLKIAAYYDLINVKRLFGLFFLFFPLYFWISCRKFTYSIC